MEPFLVARNPDPESSLPFLVRLPIGDGLVLKTRESWPRANRSYCHPAADWPLDAEVIDDPAIYPTPEAMAKLYITTAFDARTQRVLTRVWTNVKTGQ